MVSRDIRYKLIKPMLNDGDIQKFTDIFRVVPIQIVARDLGKRGDRFKELVDGLVNFKLKDLLIMANICTLSTTEMFLLVENELVHRKIKT